MKASVIAISEKSGLFAAKIEDGDCVVLEALSGEVMVRDVISSSALVDLGAINALNLTSGQQLTLYGQSGRSGLQAAVDVLRLR